MKKFLLLTLSLLSTMAIASSTEAASKPGEVELKGFLATEACLKKDYFKDCRLDTMEASPFALYVHGDNAIYKLDVTNFHAYELDEAVGKNNVTIIGKLENGNVVKVRDYKAPPPETKSFFKGCL